MIGAAKPGPNLTELLPSSRAEPVDSLRSFTLTERSPGLGMRTSHVPSTRQVYRYINRTFSHASYARLGSAQAKDAKKYSDTLLLPETTLPMRHDAAVVERTFADKTGAQLYKWQV